MQSAKHDPKGNVDADLVLRAVVEMPKYDNAVIVTGDGDYYSLVDYLALQGKHSQCWRRIDATVQACCKSAKGNLRYIEDVRHLVERLR